MRKARRWIGAMLSFSLPFMAVPAMAATTQPLDVSQIPSVYAQKGIAPNLFLLLDDSGSMQYEYLGTKGSIENYRYGFPPGRSQPYGGSMYSHTDAPGFAADDFHAAEYRAAYVNPNYYNPSITYTPWACAAKHPESGNASDDKPVSPLDDLTTCHWDASMGLWVLPDADPDKAYLSPVRTDEGFRSLNVWNDAGYDARYNNVENNGYVGDSGQSGQTCSYSHYSRHNRKLYVCDNAAVNDDLGHGNDYSKASDPSHGTVAIQSNGDFTYTPDSNYKGSDSFEYCDYSNCHRWNTHTVDVVVGSQPAGLWPATYFNYFGPRPSPSGNYHDISDYQRVQICPANNKENSNGVWSDDVCTPPPALPASPVKYHTYTDANGNYVYIKSDGTQVVRTPAEALQNFANWYQYYRSH